MRNIPEIMNKLTGSSTVIVSKLFSQNPAWMTINGWLIHLEKSKLLIYLLKKRNNSLIYETTFSINQPLPKRGQMGFGWPQGNLIQWLPRKGSKLSYHLHLHDFASMDFLALSEIRSKKESSWHWRRNASVLEVSGSSNQLDLLSKIGTAIALEKINP